MAAILAIPFIGHAPAAWIAPKGPSPPPGPPPYPPPPSPPSPSPSPRVPLDWSPPPLSPAFGQPENDPPVFDLNVLAISGSRRAPPGLQNDPPKSPAAASVVQEHFSVRLTGCKLCADVGPADMKRLLLSVWGGSTTMNASTAEFDAVDIEVQSWQLPGYDSSSIALAQLPGRSQAPLTLQPDAPLDTAAVPAYSHAYRNSFALPGDPASVGQALPRHPPPSPRLPVQSTAAIHVSLSQQPTWHAGHHLSEGTAELLAPRSEPDVPSSTVTNFTIRVRRGVEASHAWLVRAKLLAHAARLACRIEARGPWAADERVAGEKLDTSFGLRWLDSSAVATANVSLGNRSTAALVALPCDAQHASAGGDGTQQELAAAPQLDRSKLSSLASAAAAPPPPSPPQLQPPPPSSNATEGPLLQALPVGRAKQGQQQPPPPPPSQQQHEPLTPEREHQRRHETRLRWLRLLLTIFAVFFVCGTCGVYVCTRWFHRSRRRMRKEAAAAAAAQREATQPPTIAA